MKWEIIVLFLPGERDLAEVPLPAPDVQGSPPAAATALPGSAAHSGRDPPSPSQFRAELREGFPQGIISFGGKFKFRLKLQEVDGELREGPQERVAELQRGRDQARQGDLRR